MAKVEIQGTDGQAQAQTTPEGELRVCNSPYPPFVQQKVQPFRQYLTVDGLEAGSNDMGIDGSVTPVDFYIGASPSNDRYITSLNFLVAYAASGKPYLWADGAALANGTRLFYENLSGERDIHEGIKSNQDMFRLSFSPVLATWEIRHTDALNDYGYFISTDLTKMGLSSGIKLDAGSTQRLVASVQDDATAAVSFDCIAYGFERFK